MNLQSRSRLSGQKKVIIGVRKYVSVKQMDPIWQQVETLEIPYFLTCLRYKEVVISHFATYPQLKLIWAVSSWHWLIRILTHTHHMFVEGPSVLTKCCWGTVRLSVSPHTATKQAIYFRWTYQRPILWFVPALRRVASRFYTSSNIPYTGFHMEGKPQERRAFQKVSSLSL